jgi:hypothetical protein
VGFNYKFDSAKKTDLSEKKRKNATKANNGFYKISRKYVIIKNLEYSNSRFYIHKMIQLTLKLLTIL